MDCFGFSGFGLVVGLVGFDFGFGILVFLCCVLGLGVYFGFAFRSWGFGWGCVISFCVLGCFGFSVGFILSVDDVDMYFGRWLGYCVGFDLCLEIWASFGDFLLCWLGAYGLLGLPGGLIHLPS